MSASLLHEWLSPQGLIALGVLVIWVQQILMARAARRARATSLEVQMTTRDLSVAAAKKAEAAAHIAAGHAQAATVATVETTAAVNSMSGTLVDLVNNTNGISAALIASTSKASDLEGERRGIAIGMEAAATAKDKS